MESEILKSFASQGAWALLFVWLLIDTRKESKTREGKLQEIINKNQEVIHELANKFDVVEAIQEDVAEIKVKIDKVG